MQTLVCGARSLWHGVMRYRTRMVALRRAAPAVIVLLVLSGCTDRSDTEDADLASLHEFLSHSNDAVNAGDVEAEVTRFTTDGIYMWPGAPAIEGHDALRKWFEMRFAEVEVELESETLELEVIGEWAVERGRSVARIRPTAGGAAQTVRGKYLNILRRQADGTWRIARRIRNADHPTNGGTAPASTDELPEAIRGEEVSGRLTPLNPIGFPAVPPVRIDAGKSCVVDAKISYVFSGTLSGPVEIDYRILVGGPCGSPPGTFDEEWIARGTFTGVVNETATSADFSYTAQIGVGGDVDGRIVLGRGLNGELRIHGNFRDGELSYNGWVRRE